MQKYFFLIYIQIFFLGFNSFEAISQETGKDLELKEITIRPEKYKRKNPAVDLVHQVFLHKDQNRKEGLDYYQFDKHERLRFDVNGVTDAFKNRWYFEPFRFAFDYCDTNQINQKVTLPFFFRERMVTSFYKKNPTVKKERLWGERQTAMEDDYDVDKDGISTYINNMYTDVDIYEPTITLLDKQFIGPLSSAAINFYRFYITDTLKIDNQRFASVYFSPMNKNDLAFMGTMLVALDSTYAVRKVDMGISKDINLNWVSSIQIKQDFAFQGEGKARRLLLTSDVVLFDLKVWKNKEGRSLLATKINNYQNYLLNQPQADSLYKGKTLLLRDTGDLTRTPDFWLKNRPVPLTIKETGVKEMVDTVKNTRAYKNLKTLGLIMGSGYQQLGKIEVGEVGTLIRYNDLEGNRLQLTLRTRDKYFKSFRFKTYGAYGFLDKAWKYGATTSFAFKGTRVGRFPANQLRLSYEHDVFFPGLGSNASLDLFSSFQREGTSRLLLNKIEKIEYIREYKNGFSYSVFGLRKEVSEAIDSLRDGITVTTEVGGWLRFAPNEKIYQGAQQRTTLKSRYPIFFLQYKTSLKDVLGGEYAFQRLSFRVEKNFYLSLLGKSRCNVEFGKIFGQVSYPLLEVHRANQGYIFDNYGFNQMNYLEFVSDRYAMLHINHDFGGILFNRVPLIKKMKLREGLSFKALYGGLDTKNIPTETNGLQKFPVNESGKNLTQGLGKIPYLEAGLGVGNIFGFLRLEHIWRLTYTDLPNVQKTGVRMMVSVEF